MGSGEGKRNGVRSFPAKSRLSIVRRNYALMTCHYPELGSIPDCLREIFNQSEMLA